MTTPAQITICGALKTETVTALVELAMAAGAALLVQPRQAVAIAETPRLLAGEVLAPETRPRKPRRPSARAVKPARAKVAAPTIRRRKSAFRDADAETARRVLAKGPMRVRRFVAESGISIYRAQKLVADGVIIASGAQHERTFALPGKPAKEAP